MENIHLSIHDYFAIAFAFAVFFSPYYFRKKHGKAAIQSIVVSLGIFGTFVGILLGMLQFDASNLESSIQTLLSGLKLAFVTPIAGIGAALVIKAFPGFFGLKNEEDAKSDTDQLVLIRQELERVTRSLSGSEEGTLLANIKLQRAEINDKLSTLNTSFNDFAIKMVEDNKASLIEALEEVIKDFNEKISTQFGENFKHLNDGVGKMLDWQREYGEQVKMATTALQAANASLSVSADALKRSTDNSVSYVELAERMEKHISILGKSLTEIETISTSASKAFQEMQQTMDHLQTNIVESANEIMTTNTEHVEKMSREIDSNNQTFLRTANEANQKLLQTMLDSTKKLQDQVTKLDDQLGQELNKSLSTLGSQLTSLSGRFVEDYAQLAERLRAVFAQLNVR